MGIIVEWYAPNTNVISLTVDGKWTWDEFNTAMRTAHQMLDATPFDFVDYLLDMRQGDKLPSNVMSRMKSFSQHQHHKSRNMVVVGANAVIITFFNLMTRVSPQRMQHIRLVKTLEEARKYLGQSRQPALLQR